MLISNVKKNEDGTLDFDFHIEENEADFLMDFAIKELIRRGVFIVAVEKAEQEVTLFKENGGTVQ